MFNIHYRFKIILKYFDCNKYKKKNFKVLNKSSKLGRVQVILFISLNHLNLYSSFLNT